MTLSRRTLFTYLAAFSAMPVLAACTTTQDDNITTHTLNVAKIKAYAQVGLNAASTIGAVLALNPTFTAIALPISAVASALNEKLNSFTATVGDSLEISYDDTNVKTLVDSILTELDALSQTIGTALINLLKGELGADNTIVQKLTIARDALATIISVFKIMIGSFISTASGETSLSEAEALKVLNNL